MADVDIYVGARFFPFFLAVDFIRNILGKFCFRPRKKGAFIMTMTMIYFFEHSPEGLFALSSYTFIYTF